MNFVFKHTTELSDDELGQISILFERVFKKKRSKEIIRNQCVNNPLGYSYHSMIVDNDEIVAHCGYVPSYYYCNGRKLLFANSIDTMVDKPYRDFFNLKDMMDNAYRNMKKEGVAFVYGYPNDDSFPVVTKARLFKSIGKMRTYCLPLHIGGVKKNLSILNPLSELFCRLYVAISSLFASRRNSTYLYEKDQDSYNQTRYLRGDGQYLKASIDDFTLYYKIKEHEGVLTAFIIDITRKSPKAFVKSVRYIIKHHRKDFDLLLYPGYLKFLITGMIRIPRKFEPKNFNFTGYILDKLVITNDIWNIDNWDTNLSNYDLL